MFEEMTWIRAFGQALFICAGIVGAVLACFSAIWVVDKLFGGWGIAVSMGIALVLLVTICIKFAHD